MTMMTHVLAAVDLSTAAPMVIAYAHEMAQHWQARFTVLHVVHDLTYYSGAFLTDKPLSTLQHDLEVEAREHLEAICEDVCGRASGYQSLVVTGRPGPEIQRVIREEGVDCLVIGAHSEDKPEHQLFGSTAERLLHQMLCPTLVVPPNRSVDFVSKG
jgi:universal stress protein A